MSIYGGRRLWSDTGVHHEGGEAVWELRQYLQWIVFVAINDGTSLFVKSCFEVSRWEFSPCFTTAWQEWVGLHSSFLNDQYPPNTSFWYDAKWASKPIKLSRKVFTEIALVPLTLQPHAHIQSNTALRLFHVSFTFQTLLVASCKLQH